MDIGGQLSSNSHPTLDSKRIGSLSNDIKYEMLENT